jgi:hypothetical protein
VRPDPFLPARQSVTEPHNGLMNWQLAHRPRGVYDGTTVVISAPTAVAAIAQLRESIPADHLVLYVLAVDEADE